MLQEEVVTAVEQVTPDWLTGALVRSGALTYGRVESYEVVTGERILSTNARLSLSYAAGSRGEMPRRLLLKMVNADQGDEFFGSSEVDYYTRDYVGVEGAPLVRCYGAAYSAEQRRYHILMDDLSETHVERAAKEPTLEHGLALAEGLAALHAHWWGARRLAEKGESIPNAAQIMRFVDIARPGVEHIVGYCADRLASHWPDAMRDLYARHPQALIERARVETGFALIHGDANRTNVLVPRQGERPIFIIDRQPFNWSLTTWLAVYDLAYSIVLDWDTETRRRLEWPILRHYHDQLIRRGVRGYSWDRLYDDYRLCAAMCVYVATEWCRGGVDEQWTSIWLPMLQKSMTACDDLKCNQLW